MKDLRVSGKVVREYKASYEKCIKVNKGDVLNIDRSKSIDNDWPGWIWCTDSSGLGSWVPVKYIRIKSDTATVVDDYDATELNVTVGEKLMVYKEESGWYWCRNKSGQDGWVPVENVILN